MLYKTLESPLDCEEIKLVNPKGNQSWIFIGRTDADAETPILWPPDAKNWFIWKYPDAGKDWRQEEKGMTEDEMVEWHHQFNGRQFEQTSGNSEGQGSLVCCSPWGCKELDTTEQLNWTELHYPNILEFLYAFFSPIFLFLWKNRVPGNFALWLCYFTVSLMCKLRLLGNLIQKPWAFYWITAEP